MAAPVKLAPNGVVRNIKTVGVMDRASRAISDEALLIALECRQSMAQGLAATLSLPSFDEEPYSAVLVEQAPMPNVLDFPESRRLSSNCRELREIGVLGQPKRGNEMKRLLSVVAAVIGFTGAVHAADITGAGATFPFPIYSKWAEAYKKATGIGLNYQSMGLS
jgi:hypothetical protein